MTESGLRAANNWKRATLGELVIVGGNQIDPGKEPARKFRYIGLENIEAGTGRLVEFSPTRGREIASNKISFRQGDVLYGRLRPYLQKVLVAPFDGIAATELLPLRVQGEIDPEFLREVLLGAEHLADVTQLMSGARMPRVRTDELLRLNVPVPPLDEQRNIVRALTVLRHKVTNLRRKLERGAELARTFERSILTAAFNGELSAHLATQGNADESGSAYLEQILSERRASWEFEQGTQLRSKERVLRDESWKMR